MIARTRTTAALFTLALLAMPPEHGHAQGFFQRQTPETRAQTQLSFAPLVKQAAPAVVNVYAARREQRPRNSFMDDPFFREFFGGGGRQGQERVQQSVGSGVIVSSDGLVVTNYHVIDGMTEVKVALADRREFDADVILRDQRTDLAVLRLKGLGDNKIAALTLGDSEQLEVGDVVLAIGNPFGVGQTVTSGIVSALARTQVGVSDYQFFIQTDAAINPGNSGGALIDMNGKLIGINTAIFSRSGGSHGIGFAIPANMARVVIDSARGGGATVRRPWFGARLDTLDREKAEALGLDRPSGALVASVVDKSPAAEAGLKRGDIIVAVDNQEITDPDAFGFRYATKGIGGQSSVSVLRAGKRIILPVKLSAPPETRPREPVVIKSRSPLAGLTIVNMSPAVAEELSVDSAGEGVVVAAVEDGSNAQQIGFRKGDVILLINNERPVVSKDVERLTGTRSYRWLIQISRGGQVFTQQLFGG